MANKKTERLTVRVGETETEYAVFGKGTKPFVMIPGVSVKSVMESAGGVAAAYRSIAAEYRVYLFDRRKNIPEGYTVKDMAEDTADAMKALGISGAYIFGVSQGGMIAQILAILYPELVDKLVLGSTTARVSEKMAGSMKKWKELAQKGDRDGLTLCFAEGIYSQEFLGKYREMIVEFGRTVQESDLARFVRLVEACEGFDIYDRIGEIKCPVLVLGAGDDKVLGREGSEDIAEKLGCELYIYEGCGHAVYDEAPDYKDRILGFLKK